MESGCCKLANHVFGSANDKSGVMLSWIRYIFVTMKKKSKFKSSTRYTFIHPAESEASCSQCNILPSLFGGIRDQLSLN